MYKECKSIIDNRRRFYGISSQFCESVVGILFWKFYFNLDNISLDYQSRYNLLFGQNLVQDNHGYYKTKSK